MLRFFIVLFFLSLSLTVRADENKSLDFVNKALNDSNCDPTERACVLTTNSGADFLMYLQNCNILKGWVVNYNPAGGEVITSINADSQGNCIISARDTKELSKVLKQCVLNYEQFQNAAADDHLQAMRLYDANGVVTPDVIKAMNLIGQCLGDITINRVKAK